MTRRSSKISFKNFVNICVWGRGNRQTHKRTHTHTHTHIRTHIYTHTRIHTHTLTPPHSQGAPPAGLEAVQNQELRQFIELCIQHDAEARPEARQLLKSPFFESIRTGRLSCPGFKGTIQVRSTCPLKMRRQPW
jgi:serine/threonine protein kinase